jgi:hypothetical protein
MDIHTNAAEAFDIGMILLRGANESPRPNATRNRCLPRARKQLPRRPQQITAPGYTTVTLIRRSLVGSIRQAPSLPIGLSAILFILLGVIAEIQTRIYFETRGKPPYKIKSIVKHSVAERAPVFVSRW